MNDRWKLNRSLVDWPPSETIQSCLLPYPRFLSVTRGYTHSALFEGSQELAIILASLCSKLSFMMNGYQGPARELPFPLSLPAGTKSSGSLRTILSPIQHFPNSVQ